VRNQESHDQNEVDIEAARLHDIAWPTTKIRPRSDRGGWPGFAQEVVS